MSERIRAIAESWAWTYAEAIENVHVRVAIREALVTKARDGHPELLDAAWVARANAAYWSLVEDGLGDELLAAWMTWFRGAVHG